jgi:hypothetical protein
MRAGVESDEKLLLVGALRLVWVYPHARSLCMGLRQAVAVAVAGRGARMLAPGGQKDGFGGMPQKAWESAGGAAQAGALRCVPPHVHADVDACMMLCSALRGKGPRKLPMHTQSVCLERGRHVATSGGRALLWAVVHSHDWNEDPVNGCQLGTQCPILHAK